MMTRRRYYVFYCCELLQLILRESIKATISYIGLSMRIICIIKLIVVDIILFCLPQAFSRH